MAKHSVKKAAAAAAAASKAAPAGGMAGTGSSKTVPAIVKTVGASRDLMTGLGWMSMFALVVLLVTRPDEEELAKGTEGRRNLYNTGPILALMITSHLLHGAITDLFGLKPLLYSALSAARQRSAKPAAKTI
jgi:hypothetical protein